MVDLCLNRFCLYQLHLYTNILLILHECHLVERIWNYTTNCINPQSLKWLQIQKHKHCLFIGEYKEGTMQSSFMRLISMTKASYSTL